MEAIGRRVSHMKSKRSVLIEQKGFTLLETMVTVLILATVMMSMPLIFQMFHSIDRTVTIEEDFEWNLFLIHLRQDMLDANQFRITNTRLYYVKNNQGIMYEDYGNTLRRRKDALGHEVILQNIKTHRFSIEGHLISLKVEFVNGVEEEAQFVIPQGRDIQ